MKSIFLRIGMFSLLAAGITTAVIFRDELNAEQLTQWLQDSGNAAPLLFMLIYILGTVFFLPGSIMTLLGGALFGPVWGVLYNLTAATIGATLSFLAARYLASDWVANKTGGKMKQLISGVENEGWRFVAFTRLVPLFPFNLLNYALGLTKIPLTQYSFATFLFMAPGAIAYTYLGYAGKEAIAGGENMVQKIMLAIALLAIASFLPRLISKLRSKPMISAKELKQRLDSDDKVLLLDVRTAKDYAGEQSHIKGSKLIPIEELEQRLNEISHYQSKTVITICRTDRKSVKAAQLLSTKGFNNVLIAKMGMTDWHKMAYPINETK